MPQSCRTSIGLLRSVLLVWVVGNVEHAQLHGPGSGRGVLGAVAVHGDQGDVLVLLGVSLPATASAQHWSLAWAGLDAGEAIFAELPLADAGIWLAVMVPGKTAEGW